MSCKKTSSYTFIEQWIQCPEFGNLINDMFVPFKTPIDANHEYNIPKEKIFNLEIFLASKRSRDIGMIIDLSSKAKYYDPEKLSGIKCYNKMDSYEGVPSFEQVNSFIELAHSFFELNQDAFIGVHCNFGYNATGFMIICYLFERCNIQLDAAIHIFSNARQPGLYSQKFLDELTHRYKLNTSLLILSIPLWFMGSEDEDQDQAAENTDVDVSQYSELTPTVKAKVVTKSVSYTQFERGVSKVNIQVTQKLVYETLKKLMHTRQFGWLATIPAPMTVENYTLIIEKPYFVTWRPISNRYVLLVMNSHSVYAVDKKNYVHKVDYLKFPWKDDTFLTDTVFEGDMTIDIIEDQKIPRYLINDIVSLNGQYVGNIPFDERQKLIDSVLKFRRDNIPEENLSRQTFAVDKKPYWPIEQTKEVWEGKIHDEIKHKMSSLIFQPRGDDDFYQVRESTSMLQWKPPDRYTVNFAFQVYDINFHENDPEFIGKLIVSGQLEPYFVFEDISDEWVDKYGGKIVECVMDRDTHKWDVVRTRPDLHVPDNNVTANAIIKITEAPLYLSDLYKIIDERSK